MPGKRGEKLLTLDRVFRPKVSEIPNSSTANSTSSAALKQNPEFSEGIRGAQFFNSDKLIVLSCANKLYFYQYELPVGQNTKDDVKRLQQRGLYKLLQSFEHPSAH